MSRLIAALKRSLGVSRLRKNISMTLGRQLLAAFAQFILVVLIARELGPEGNGFYAVAVLIPTMLANLLNFGIGPATVYHVSRGDFSSHQAFAGNWRLAVMISAGGILIGLPVLFVWGSEIFPSVPVGFLYLGLASFPLNLLLSLLNSILQGQENFKAFNLTILLPPYVNLTGVVIALYILPFGVFGAMAAYICGQLVGLIAVVICLLRSGVKAETEVSPMPACKYSLKTLSYGWKVHLSNILAFVNYRADIFLVNLFLTPAATGIYVISVQMAEKLWMLSQAASTVLLPRLAAMRENPKERLTLARKGFFAVSLLTAFASGLVGLALFWLLIPIFGEEYADALPAFLWLLPGIIAGAGSRIYSNCIAASGKPEWNMYSSIGVVVLNVVGNITLIPDFGIVGAAWATSLAYCCNAVIKVWLVQKVTGLG